MISELLAYLGWDLLIVGLSGVGLSGVGSLGDDVA